MSNEHFFSRKHKAPASKGAGVFFSQPDPYKYPQKYPAKVNDRGSPKGHERVLGKGLHQGGRWGGSLDEPGERWGTLGAAGDRWEGLGEVLITFNLHWHFGWIAGVGVETGVNRGEIRPEWSE
jgi:hypothetical protein